MIKIATGIAALFLFGAPAWAATEDEANQAKFEKECAAMIAKGAPCGEVAKGGGGRRGCVARDENIGKATPACKAVIGEWKELAQKKAKK